MKIPRQEYIAEFKELAVKRVKNGMRDCTTIRIGTWNVEYAKNTRNPDRLKRLSDFKADIWILTETHRSLHLPACYTSYPSDPRPNHHRNVDADSTWVTIWSQLELSERIEVPDPRRQVAAIFKSPIGLIAVAGVVVPWLCDNGDAYKPDMPRPANWSEHKWVLANEIPTLLKNLSANGKCHRVLGGDFNTDLAPPYTYGPPGRARDDWHSLLKRQGLVCHTKDEPYPNSPCRKLIDHICTDFGAPLSLETWSGDDGKKPHLSDHPGVVLDFSLTTNHQ